MIVYKCDKCGKEMVSPKYIYFPVSNEWPHEVIDGVLNNPANISLELS